jgi:transglutaminase-like putative cysteine protease
VTTLAPPPAAPASPPETGHSARAAEPSGRRDRAAGRTLIGLLASALAVIPLKTLFSDNGWLVDAWLAMLVVIVPAAALRLRRPAGALDIWPGILLLVPWLTGRYVSGHAWLGIIPTTGTWHDISRLMNALHHTTRDEVAPVHTTIAIRLVLCALVGLLAALIDLVAVVGHRAALAGVPMLAVYTIAGAVPRTPVPWIWFTFAAIGYLLLLGLDAESDVRNWGRHIRGRRRRSSAPGASVTGKRIAVIAVLAAIALPLLAPSHPRNLLADVFHHHGSGPGAFGAGGDGGSISPFAALKGQLTRSKPIPLMNVHVSGAGRFVPFYLRVNVLSEYSAKGWSAADHGATEPIASTGFNTTPPPGPGERRVPMQARITISGLDGNVPVFAVPDAVSGVDPGTSWSPLDQLLIGSVHSGQVINEHFEQPEPTLLQLRSSPAATQDVGGALGSVPSGVPDYARRLVARLTGNAGSPYQRALAIQRYFTDPGNGFVYDLRSSVGDSGSALVDFLKGKHGFCQQYAAAMAVMLRVAGVPSRVVLGYMHDAPDASGNFSVSTEDAHAWVEAYFRGIGWIPFDPTPASGLADPLHTDLRWAKHAGGGGQPNNTDINRPNATGSGHPSTGAAGSSGPTPGTAQHHGGGGGGAAGGISLQTVLTVVIVLAVLLVLLIPALIRWRRRRRRLAAARRDGDAEALWAELSDTAVDLGYVWSPARSPRQVAQWLSRDARNSHDSLHALATAVEQHRYAPDAESSDGHRLGDELRRVTGELRHRRDGRTRLGAVLWPASLTASVRWWPTRRTSRRH